MTCSPSHGWLCRSTPCASFPPRMRSQLQGSDFYPGGSTSHWIHQPSPGHTVRLLSPEPVVVTQPQSTRVEEPTLLCNQSYGPRVPNRTMVAKLDHRSALLVSELTGFVAKKR